MKTLHNTFCIFNRYVQSNLQLIQWRLDQIHTGSSRQYAGTTFALNRHCGLIQVTTVG